MATISVRKLDGNADPIFGNGTAAFITDIDAVAQIIYTRLRLFQGEWWENANLGLPLFQSILGGSARSTQAMAMILQQYILATPYVTGVQNLQITSVNRQIAFSCQVQTQFGTVTISTNSDQNSASLNT